MTAALTTSRSREAVYWRNEHAVNPESGTTIEDMLKPTYWAHVAKSYKPWDKIEARAEDGSFFAVFLVRDSGRNWVRVELLQHWPFADAGVEDAPAIAPEYITKWRGPHAKWSVVRVIDKNVMREGFENQDQGSGWIKDHLKALAK